MRALIAPTRAPSHATSASIRPELLALRDFSRYSRAISALYGIGFVMWFLDMRQLIGNEEALA